MLVLSEMFPRQVHVGWRLDLEVMAKQREKNNSVRTARYTKMNWVPVSLFNQLKKLANIYFLVITFLAFVPNAPKTPYFSLLTLSIMLAFLVIKDGQEDKARRLSDEQSNQREVNTYSYGLMGFASIPQRNLRVGDIVTVFNNEEIPADLLMLNAHSGVAFMETVNLDGEAMLSQKYAFEDNVNVSQLQQWCCQVHCSDPSPAMHEFDGLIKLSGER